MAFTSQGFNRIRCLKGAMMRFSSTAPKLDIKKSVFISQSKDVYSNLALESWLYRNFDFSKHHVLLIWQNEPSVTIGKSLNPWHEVNIPEMQHITENGIKLARRSTDGEAVYQDEGNLNLTFFTSKKTQDSRYNLEIIRRAIFREFGVKADTLFPSIANSSKQDFSESVSALGQTNSLHHCNICINVDQSNMKKSLLNYENGPTKVIRPKLRNLNDVNRRVTLKSALKAVGWEFLRTTPLRLIDGGLELANQQKGFQMINPTDKWFPGITEIKQNLESWEWCYGQTPEFSISRTFPVPNYLMSSFDGPSEDLKITVLVQKGRISDVTLFIPHGLSASGFTGETDVITTLKGQKFSEEGISTIQSLLGGLVNEKEKFVTDCVKQVMSCA